MLVLSRRRKESIVIDEQVKITVLEIRSGRVRLGIEAPSGNKILREELALAAADTRRPTKEAAA